MKKENRALGILLLTAAIWGFAFTAQKTGADRVPVFTFGAWRYIAGAAALYLITLPLRRKKGLPALDQKAVLPGMLLGTVLFCAANLQQLGVALIGPGKCGFLTTLYVVLVPVLGKLLFGKKTAPGTWLALPLAVLALYLLCGTGESLTPTRGDLLALGGSVFWALHILFTDRYTGKYEAIDLCTVQFFWCGLMDLFFALALENVPVRDVLAVWPELLYLSVLSTAGGYTLQTIGQRDAKPAHAAIVLSMESVFSVLGGAIFLGERMRPAAYLGCAVMLAAVLISQLSGMKEGLDTDV